MDIEPNALGKLMAKRNIFILLICLCQGCQHSPIAPIEVTLEPAGFHTIDGKRIHITYGRVPQKFGFNVTLKNNLNNNFFVDGGQVFERSVRVLKKVGNEYQDYMPSIEMIKFKYLVHEMKDDPIHPYERAWQSSFDYPSYLQAEKKLSSTALGDLVLSNLSSCLYSIYGNRLYVRASSQQKQLVSLYGINMLKGTYLIYYSYKVKRNSNDIIDQSYKTLKAHGISINDQEDDGFKRWNSNIESEKIILDVN